MILIKENISIFRVSAGNGWNGEVCMSYTRSTGPISMYRRSCALWRFYRLSWWRRRGTTGMHVLQNGKWFSSHFIMIAIFWCRCHRHRCCYCSLSQTQSHFAELHLHFQWFWLIKCLSWWRFVLCHKLMWNHVTQLRFSHGIFPKNVYYQHVNPST